MPLYLKAGLNSAATHIAVHERGSDSGSRDTNSHVPEKRQEVVRAKGSKPGSEFTQYVAVLLQFRAACLTSIDVLSDLTRYVSKVKSKQTHLPN